MRIGIDARLYSESGVGRYIRNLISNLGEIDKDNEYVVFLLKKNLNVELPKNFKKVNADIPWYTVKEQIQLPKILNSQRLDLMHFPHFNVPVFYNGKFIVTIHDLIHQKYQMRRATTHDPLIYRLKLFGYNKVFGYAVRSSEKIITVSNYVKEELVNGWRVDPEKIVVTKEGVEENLLSLSKKITKSECNKTLETYGIKRPFVFYAGNAHPHKNVEGLIKAFLRVKVQAAEGPWFRHKASEPRRRRGESVKDLQLVLSGNDHYFWQRIKKSLQLTVGSEQKDIIFTGYISDEELVAFYKTAECYVVPSFEEGFGIPLLEAMALGCPVVSSNAASLPEVGGDACVYFNPKDTNEMAQKIEEVLNDQKLRYQLIEMGGERVGLFSWRRLAEETLKLYRGIS